MSQPTPLVDFATVMMDLRRHGLSYRFIAEHVGTGETTVKDYANLGARPSFDIGDKLVGLWAGITNNDRSRVPRIASPHRRETDDLARA